METENKIKIKMRTGLSFNMINHPCAVFRDYGGKNTPDGRFLSA